MMQVSPTSPFAINSLLLIQLHFRSKNFDHKLQTLSNHNTVFFLSRIMCVSHLMYRPTVLMTGGKWHCTACLNSSGVALIACTWLWCTCFYLPGYQLCKIRNKKTVKCHRFWVEGYYILVKRKNFMYNTSFTSLFLIIPEQ